MGPYHYGIPQGSVISPVLFIIYINDLPESVHNEVYLFDDDTKIYSEIMTPRYTMYSEIKTVEDCVNI